MLKTDHGLYPYQAKAARIMEGSDVLLAFEMGTGKTPTTLAAIEALRAKVRMTPGTVVVPASLKWQWQREVHKFTDQQALVIDGTPTRRLAQYQRIKDEQPGYVIMTYDCFVRDWKLHANLAHGFLVLDEATAIKSYSSKRSQHIKKVSKVYGPKFALTGTPIENGKAEELYSILEFVDPNILGKFFAFDHRYIRRNQMGWIEGYKNLEDFHRTIKPYVLRATHKEPAVAKYLPKVLYRDPVMVPLDIGTRRAVDKISAVLKDDLDSVAASLKTYDLDNPRPGHPDGRIMAKIQVLRMLLDHPDAVRLSAAKYNDPQSDLGSSFADEVVSAGFLSTATPKMDCLEAYLKDFLDADSKNKAVVFTSFIHVADRIAHRFPGKAVVFNGNMTPQRKDQAKHQFASDPDCRMFVSTDAGGYGLDLPEANLVCNYDLPWQAGMLKQRNARIRRASSTWPYVIVQDFIAEGTIEERMRSMLDHKIAVSEAIVDGEGITESGGVASDLDSLRSFLSDTERTKTARAS